MNLKKENFDQELPAQKPNEAVKSAKEVEWERKREEVDKITDRIGTEIDENIKEAVTAFRIYEFPTTQSCEGHISEGEIKRGLPFLWIQICLPEPEGWHERGEREKESEEKRKEWKKKEKEWEGKNFEQQKKMMDLLAEFYQGRETPFDARLVFENSGGWGGFRVQSFGAKMMILLSTAEQKQKLELYQKEMNDFTKFLKDKYFLSAD